MMKIKKIIEELTKRGETLATMESCTGGGLVDAITSIEGASCVLKYSAVTYSNEFKIKMGVNKDVIEKYSVYSIQTAHEMALKIVKYAEANMGIGITGKLNRADQNNNYGQDNVVFISIYYKDEFYDMEVKVDKKTRKQNKRMIIDMVINKVGEILWGGK